MGALPPLAAWSRQEGRGGGEAGGCVRRFTDKKRVHSGDSGGAPASVQKSGTFIRTPFRAGDAEGIMGTQSQDGGERQCAAEFLGGNGRPSIQDEGTEFLRGKGETFHPG